MPNGLANAFQEMDVSKQHYSCSDHPLVSFFLLTFPPTNPPLVEQVIILNLEWNKKNPEEFGNRTSNTFNPLFWSWLLKKKKRNEQSKTWLE